MENDLVDRLRGTYVIHAGEPMFRSDKHIHKAADLHEAADEITALRDRVAALEGALRPFDRAWKYWRDLKRLEPDCEGAQAGPKGFVIPSEFEAAHALLANRGAAVGDGK